MNGTEPPVQDEHGIWAYALAECDPGATLPGPGGVAGADARLVDCGGLTAVVSDVGLEEFGTEALRRNLEDLSWLEAVARAHHRVIEAAARRFMVLPMRLATVYTSEESMAAALTAHAPRLRDSMEWLRSRTEWGVKGYVAASREVPRDATSRAAAAGGESSRHGARHPQPGAGSGMAYLRQRRDALSARRDAEQNVAESARAVHAELEQCAVASHLHPPQSQQLSGHADPMVLNAAYLIDDDRARDFAAAVQALSEREPRLSLELTGPWPPYSFAVHELEQEGV
jgi:hypothetical protein